MKQKRILLIALIFVVIAIIWVFVLQQFLKIDQTKEQNEYVSKADSFVEKELYVRAIDAYEKALKINTTDEKENQIEQKLLNAYLNYGDDMSYESLAESRINSGVATEEEIVNLIQMYASSYLFSDAIASAKSGLELFPESESIQTKYDEIRFMYTLTNLNVSEIKPDDNTGKLAANMDGKWCYINSTGSLIYKVTFDEATPFYKDDNGGQYAVVKSEGTYYVINKDCALYGRDDTGVEEVAGIAANHVIAKKDGKYGFYNYDFELSSETHRYDLITLNSNGVTAVMDGDKWGVITNGGETVIPLELDEIAINSLNQAYRGGNAMVKQGNAWSLVDLEGNQVGEDTYSDAKAPESTGLIAVANDQSKWGFIDRTGKLVIDYQYDDAYSFSDDVAAVKQAGDWIYINEKNQVVVEDGFDEAMPFHNGYAIAKIGDNYLTIKFDNYE